MIKAEELRNKLYEYFKDKDILNACFKDLKDNIEPNEVNIKRRQVLAKDILKTKKHNNGEELTPAEIEDYKKLSRKQGAKDALKTAYKTFNKLENKLFSVLNTKQYDTYIKHLVFNAPLKDGEEYLSEVTESSFSLWIDAIYNYVFRYCFYDNSGVKDKRFNGSMSAIIYNGAFETITNRSFNEYLKSIGQPNPILSYVNEIGEDEEEFIKVVQLYSEIKERINTLVLTHTDDEQEHQEKTQAEEEITTNFIAPRLLYYADSYTIADTEILNILTTQQFNADMTVFNKSERKLNSLRHQDREILDYIVLTLYPNDIRVFSDYQIATGLYKKETSETVSDSMLKEINASIERIRNIRLDEGFISKEKINDLNTKVEINGNLIVLNRVKVKHRSKATYYQIMTRPFYYDYALNTGKKIEHYPKELISRDIEDVKIEHNIKNDTLKMMLTRRVLSLEFYNKTIINVLEIYDTLGVTDPRKYTDARNRAEAILKDLQQKDYNFKYTFKKKQRTVTQLVIEKYTDRPLKIEKSFS